MRHISGISSFRPQWEPAARANPTPTIATARRESRRHATPSRECQRPPVTDGDGQHHLAASASSRPPTEPAASVTPTPICSRRLTTPAAACRQNIRRAPATRQRQQLRLPKPTASAAPLTRQRPPANTESRSTAMLATADTRTTTRAIARRQPQQLPTAEAQLKRQLAANASSRPSPAPAASASHTPESNRQPPAATPSTTPAPTPSAASRQS